MERGGPVQSRLQRRHQETEAETDAVGMAMGGDPAMAQGLGSMVQAPPMPAQESVDPAIMKDMLMFMVKY